MESTLYGATTGYLPGSSQSTGRAREYSPCKSTLLVVFFENTTTHQIEINMSTRTHERIHTNGASKQIRTRDGRIWFSKSRGLLPDNLQHFKVIQPEWKQ